MLTPDPITSPEHYTVHFVQPIAITRHLCFCLGNAVKYVLRAPYKGGAQDLRKALEYLKYEDAEPSAPPSVITYNFVESACQDLIACLLREDEGPNRPPAEEDEVWGLQADFLVALDGYLETGFPLYLENMRAHIEALLVCMERQDTENRKQETGVGATVPGRPSTVPGRPCETGDRKQGTGGGEQGAGDRIQEART